MVFIYPKGVFHSDFWVLYSDFQMLSMLNLNTVSVRLPIWLAELYMTDADPRRNGSSLTSSPDSTRISGDFISSSILRMQKTIFVSARVEPMNNKFPMSGVGLG